MRKFNAVSISTQYKRCSGYGVNTGGIDFVKYFQGESCEDLAEGKMHVSLDHQTTHPPLKTGGEERKVCL